MYGYGYSPFIKSIPSSSGGTPVDPDAQAFITAASITNPTQQSAINTLVTDLKGYGVWTKMKALYPFVGGTASQHKFNLKNPLDTDAAFRLVFNGGITHNENGVTLNGTNGFADTYFNANSNNLTNGHISIYNRTNNAGSYYDFSNLTGATEQTIIIKFTDNKYYINSGTQTYPNFVNADARGLYTMNYNTTNVKGYRNGSVVITETKISTGVNNNYTIGRNSSGQYSNRNYAFASIGDGLTDTEAANFYTAVQTFQVTLGRSIGTQTVSDADAQAFVTNAGIVDQVEADAVNNLVIGLKSDGLWSKMKAIYPFVGSSATSNSYNLKNTAQYQITWNGGVTHSSTGVTFNGTNGYGNTGLIPSSVLTLNNTHLSFYSRTNGSLGIDLGSTSTGDTSSLFIAQNYFSNFYADSYSGTSRFTLPIQTSGLLTISRTSINSFKAFKNATQIGSTITSTSGSLPNWNLFLGATNLNGATNPTAYSARNIAFATIGDGLTDADVTNLNSKITTFNTTLNRQV